jgi:hypothetical protein
MYNQEIMSVLQKWSGIADEKNHLHPDIRMFSKRNSFYLEQWDKTKCVERIIVTHIHAKVENENRDVTTQDCDLNYRTQGSWLILIQTPDGSN